MKILSLQVLPPCYSTQCESPAQARKSKATNYTFATTILLLLLLRIVPTAPLYSLFIATAKPTKTKKNPRWLATNECTIDEMKILYILPITTIMMLVMSRNKRTQKVLLSFKRFFNNVEAKKGPKKFTFFCLLWKKRLCTFGPFFFLLFDYRKVHNSLFKWTFLICALLKKTLRFISKPFLWKSTLLFFSLSSMQRKLPKK